MSWISYDYTCDNEKCEVYQIPQDLLVEREEVDSQLCKYCQCELTRLFTPTKFPVHGSWSNWRIM